MSPMRPEVQGHVVEEGTVEEVAIGVVLSTRDNNPTGLFNGGCRAPVAPQGDGHVVHSLPAHGADATGVVRHQPVVGVGAQEVSSSSPPAGGCRSCGWSPATPPPESSGLETVVREAALSSSFHPPIAILLAYIFRVTTADSPPPRTRLNLEVDGLPPTEVLEKV